MIGMARLGFGFGKGGGMDLWAGRGSRIRPVCQVYTQRPEWALILWVYNGRASEDRKSGAGDKSNSTATY